MRTMNLAHQLAGIVLLIVAGLVAKESVELGIHAESGIAPGLFPLGASLLLALASALVVWQAASGKREPMLKDYFGSRLGRLRIVLLCLAMAGVVVLMVPLGFRFTMIAFYLVAQITWGVRPWVALAVALVVGLGSFWLFNDVLKIVLPMGPLDSVFDIIGGLHAQ